MFTANRRPIFTLKNHGIDGLPDGMTIDKDGNLWIAVFNGYKVIKIDPRKPETLLQTIDIPAKQVKIMWKICKMINELKTDDYNLGNFSGLGWSGLRCFVRY